jgi:hypothetical protein
MNRCGQLDGIQGAVYSSLCVAYSETGTKEPSRKPITQQSTPECTNEHSGAALCVVMDLASLNMRSLREHSVCHYNTREETHQMGRNKLLGNNIRCICAHYSAYTSSVHATNATGQAIERSTMTDAAEAHDLVLATSGTRAPGQPFPGSATHSSSTCRAANAH